MTMEIQELIEKLPHLDWWHRRKIIEDLLTHPEDEYTGFLEDGIRNHEEANVRNAAMEVYAALGPRAFSSLSALQKDEDPEIRLFSVNVLCEIRDAGTLPFLFASIKDPDMNVRAATAEALGRIGDPQALGMLQEALRDDPWVAMAAINAIGEIGGEQVLLILYDCLKHESSRAMAIDALEKAGNKESIQPLALCMASEDVREMALPTEHDLMLLRTKCDPDGFFLKRKIVEK